MQNPRQSKGNKFAGDSDLEHLELLKLVLLATSMVTRIRTALLKQQTSTEQILQSQHSLKQQLVDFNHKLEASILNSNPSKLFKS